MENLTIKQLLDLGARIDISFHNCENQEEAESKVNSLGYDGAMEYRQFEPVKNRHGFSSYGTADSSSVEITAYYDRVYLVKEDK